MTCLDEVLDPPAGVISHLKIMSGTNLLSFNFKVMQLQLLYLHTNKFKWGDQFIVNSFQRNSKDIVYLKADMLF